MTQPSDVPPPKVPPSQAPARLSRLAVASLLLGLCAVLSGALAAPISFNFGRPDESGINQCVARAGAMMMVFCSIPAMVLGATALTVVLRQRGRLVGCASAIAGIALAILSLYALLVRMPIVDGISPTSRCSHNLRQICMAYGQYYKDHDGAFPRLQTELQQSVQGILNLNYHCAADKAPSYYCISYGPNVKARDCVDLPLVFETYPNHSGGLNVGFVAGDVQWMKRSSLLLLLEKKAKDRVLPEAARQALADAATVVKSRMP